MNIQEYIAHQTERIGDHYCQFIRSTRPDKLDWRPTMEGAEGTRSILEQTHECITVNYRFASMLRREALPEATAQAPADADEACELLLKSSMELATAIRGVTDEDLENTYVHPRGEMLGKNLILMALRNMSYHIGQLNLIQMLYGDAEFHVPTTWR